MVKAKRTDAEFSKFKDDRMRPGRFRFSLRSLLLFVALSSLPLAVVRWHPPMAVVIAGWVYSIWFWAAGRIQKNRNMARLGCAAFFFVCVVMVIDVIGSVSVHGGYKVLGNLKVYDSANGKPIPGADVKIVSHLSGLPLWEYSSDVRGDVSYEIAGEWGGMTSLFGITGNPWRIPLSLGSYEFEVNASGYISRKIPLPEALGHTKWPRYGEPFPDATIELKKVVVPTK